MLCELFKNLNQLDTNKFDVEDKYNKHQRKKVKQTRKGIRHSTG